MKTSRRSLRTVDGALRHFWWLWFLFTALGAAGALFAATERVPTYQATALLNLDSSQVVPSDSGAAGQADQFMTQRFIALATDRQVLGKACAVTRTPRCDPTSLAPRVSAATGKATGIIQIAVSASSPTEAASLANAIADEIVRQNQVHISATLDPPRIYLQNELKLLTDRAQAIRNQLAVVQRGPATEGAIANASAPLVADLNHVQSQQAETSRRLQDLDVQKSHLMNSLAVFQRATPPATPIDPNRPIYIAVGVVAGLLVGFLAALLMERLDTRIRDSGQLAEATWSRLVLEMPRSMGSPPRAGQQSPEASYAMAHASMVARYEGVRSVIVVAAAPGDQVDDVGLGLARAAAELGDRVLVIQSRQGNAAWQDPESRLRPDFLRERTSRVVVEAATGEQGRSTLPATDGFDLVIASTPPPAYSPVAMTMLGSVDVGIIVATRNRTRFREARWTAEVMRHTGVQLGGSILLPRPGARAWRPARLLHLAAPAVRVPEAGDQPVEMSSRTEAGQHAPSARIQRNRAPGRPVEGGDVAGA